MRSTGPVDREFFSKSRVKSNFSCAIGEESYKNSVPRNSPLTFEDAGRLAQLSRESPSDCARPVPRSIK